GSVASVSGGVLPGVPSSAIVSCGPSSAIGGGGGSSFFDSEQATATVARSTRARGRNVMGGELYHIDLRLPRARRVLGRRPFARHRAPDIPAAMIDLYTAPTPNGWKASITLEELELPYEVQIVNLMAGDQKKP